jgi:signal transduction histidine kinase
MSTAPKPAIAASDSNNIASIGDLLALLRHFLGIDRTRAEMEEFSAQHGYKIDIGDDAAPRELMELAQRRLSEVLGSTGARVIIDTLERRREVLPLEELGALLSATSSEIQFNRTLLRATLEHVSQGVSVVDRDLRLTAWNYRYVRLFNYPPGLITLGRSIEEVLRYNAEIGLLGDGEVEEKIARRVSFMRQGKAYTHERELPDGTVIEIRGNPMPDGGFVTSYLDVTEYKRTQRQLQAINETLESRVIERTAELTAANVALSEAKLAAERANQAKTRFLASASHDLVQPLNAARLFVSAIDRRGVNEATERLINQVESSLTSAESLLGALLDITRLDAAAQELKREHFELSQVIEPLATEFSAFARTRALEFRVVPSRVIVHTDPRLLRRVLQNFLSNAVRYTRTGRVLLGVRRLKGKVRIEVWDTGLGIPVEKQKEIFEEFRRLDTQDVGGERGLGLGLAIADRLARLLDHPIGVRSRVGHGSAFSITVPLGDRHQITTAQPTIVRRSADGVSGAHVLCIDNEPAVLGGMDAMLSSWGCVVTAVRDGETAVRKFRESGQVPDLVLVDYHLDSDVDGTAVFDDMRDIWGRDVPGIVITADHTQQAKEDAMKRGLQLLPKPVKPAALRALMGRLLTAR